MIGSQPSDIAGGDPSDSGALVAGAAAGEGSSIGAMPIAPDIGNGDGEEKGEGKQDEEEELNTWPSRSSRF